MSSILDTRETLLKLIGHSDLPNDLKRALTEWLHGCPKLLREKFPEVSIILRQRADFQTSLIKYTSYLEMDEIAREAEEMVEVAKPVIRAHRQISVYDRAFDLINDCVQFLFLESLIRKCNIINNRRDYVYNRRKFNKQCLIGFVVVLYRNGCFKKINPLKPGSNKTVTLHDALIFCQERYHFGSLDSFKKNKKLCIDRALERIPGLQEFEKQNKQKIKTT